MFTKTAVFATFALAVVPVAPSSTASLDQSRDSGEVVSQLPPASGAQAILYVGNEQNVGYAVSFDASQSKGMNPLGTADIFGVKTYTWDFADGTPQQSSAYLPTITHTFSKPGTYAVTLAVTDFQGSVDRAKKQVNVGALSKVSVVQGDLVAAIKALNGKPGIISIPSGDFSLASGAAMIDVPGNVIIEGAGPSKTRLKDVSLHVKGDNVRITGMEIDGQGKNSWLHCYGRHNLLIDHCNTHHHIESTHISEYASVTFEDNDIHDNDYAGMGYGIEVGGGAYAMVRRNHFERNRHAIAAGGRSGRIPSEYVSFPTGYDFLENQLSHDPKNYDASIDMHPTGHGRVRISNNTIHDVRYGIGMKDAWGEIKDNNFANIRGWAIKFGEPTHNGNRIEGAGVYRMAVEGNHFDHVPVSYDVLYGTDITIEGQRITPPFRGNTPAPHANRPDKQ